MLVCTLGKCDVDIISVSCSENSWAVEIKLFRTLSKSFYTYFIVPSLLVSTSSIRCCAAIAF